MGWDTEFFYLIPADSRSRSVFLFILSAKLKMQKVESWIGALFYKKNQSVISRWEGGFLQYFPFKSLSDSFDILLCETDPLTSFICLLQNTCSEHLHQHQKPAHPRRQDLLIVASSQKTRQGRWWQTKVSTLKPLSKAKWNIHQLDLHNCFYLPG